MSLVAESAPRPAAKRRLPWLREMLYRLRTEGDTPARQAAAVALGLFVGCTPLYGLHLALCVVLARVFGLNRVKTYLAAHISTPVLMPFLIFLELQTGRLALGRPLLSLRPAQISAGWRWDAEHLQFWHWKSWGELMVGSLVVGALLAVLGALATLWLLRRSERPAAIEALIGETSHAFLDAGLMHCEMVRGKLRHDPIYFSLLQLADLPRSGRLLDLGCGRGIALALLATARAQGERGIYPADWPPAPALELHGIEVSPRTAAAARDGLGCHARIQTADLRTAELPAVDAILLLDVLHYLPPAHQKSLLERAIAALPSGGLLLVREADAAAGWRFAAVRVSERLMTLLRRDWRQWREGFHYRSPAAWLELLATLGLHAEVQPMDAGTPYANVLIRSTRR